jgi:acyl-coenzyme A thioesterase PaaI-like protein
VQPAGTVSGPTLFTRADFSVYVAIIATPGEAGIDAGTTNWTINFLAKAEPRDLIAGVRLLRLGRRLAVGEAQLFSDGAADPVAHAIATDALPSSPRDL